MKLLISVDYRDNTGKFWFDSSIKNKIVNFDIQKETIHSLIKNLCEEEGMELTYKGKPQGNIYRDLKDGGQKIVGYLYRGKSEIYDNHMVNPKTVNFDVWVSINTVTEFVFEVLGE
jgi:hypothetical protein